eukprot:scaffold39867_cov31-Attheya_sp.AAC.1
MAVVSSVTVAGLVAGLATPNDDCVVPFGAVGLSRGQLPRIPLWIHRLSESTVVSGQIVVDVTLVLLSPHHHESLNRRQMIELYFSLKS